MDMSSVLKVFGHKLKYWTATVHHVCNMNICTEFHVHQIVVELLSGQFGPTN